MTPPKIPIISGRFLQADVVPRASVFLVLLRKLKQRCTNFYCTNVESRRQKRFRSLYFRAETVTSVTETIAVRKYSTQWGASIRRGSCRCSLTPTKELISSTNTALFLLLFVCG